MATKAGIIQIGNSRGVRIPKSLLGQSELPEELEIQAEPGRLIVSAARPGRGTAPRAARYATWGPGSPARVRRRASRRSARASCHSFNEV
jgi:antitoxin component of MazEF toxin-antitoxin module